MNQYGRWVPRTYFSEVWAELRHLLKGFVAGVVLLPLVAGVSTGIFAPSADASALERGVFGFAGAAAAFIAVALVLLVIALVRVPAKEHRRRHQLTKLGKGSTDLGLAILNLLPFSEFSLFDASQESGPSEQADKAFAQRIEGLDWADQSRIHARYEQQYSAQVFSTADSLFRAEVIDREQRDELIEEHETIMEMVYTARKFITYGYRLNPPRFSE